MSDYPIESIPTEPGEMRKRTLAPGEGKDGLPPFFTLYGTLGWLWLPIRRRGMIHGACWRYEGRNAIVLKQSSMHEAGWAFDLLHELFHAAQRSKEKTFELVEAEATSSQRRESDGEIANLMGRSRPASSRET